MWQRYQIYVFSPRFIRLLWIANLLSCHSTKKQNFLFLDDRYFFTHVISSYFFCLAFYQKSWIFSSFTKTTNKAWNHIKWPPKFTNRQKRGRNLWLRFCLPSIGKSFPIPTTLTSHQWFGLTLSSTLWDAEKNQLRTDWMWVISPIWPIL